MHGLCDAVAASLLLGRQSPQWLPRQRSLCSASEEGCDKVGIACFFCRIYPHWLLKVCCLAQIRYHISERDLLIFGDFKPLFYLAAEMTTLLLRGKLILKVDSCSSRLNHALHQLIHIKLASKACLCVCNNGRIPVPLGAALSVLNLISSLQGLQDQLAALKAMKRAVALTDRLFR